MEVKKKKNLSLLFSDSLSYTHTQHSQGALSRKEEEDSPVPQGSYGK